MEGNKAVYGGGEKTCRGEIRSRSLLRLLHLNSNLKLVSAFRCIDIKQSHYYNGHL